MFKWRWLASRNIISTITHENKCVYNLRNVCFIELKGKELRLFYPTMTCFICFEKQTEATEVYEQAIYAMRVM